jgi:hypothetical protein
MTDITRIPLPAGEEAELVRAALEMARQPDGTRSVSDTIAALVTLGLDRPYAVELVNRVVESGVVKFA